MVSLKTEIFMEVKAKLVRSRGIWYNYLREEPQSLSSIQQTSFMWQILLNINWTVKQHTLKNAFSLGA